MTTPAFDQTVQAHIEHSINTAVRMMVVIVKGQGPSVACASCGDLANVHSTDLDRLNGWANEHRSIHHS